MLMLGRYDHGRKLESSKGMVSHYSELVLSIYLEDEMIAGPHSLFRDRWRDTSLKFITKHSLNKMR